MSNRDVAPRLRALDERVTKLEGGGMSEDLERKARKIVENINLGATDSSIYAAFCLLENKILKALQDVREADAQVVKDYYDTLPIWIDTDKYHIGRHVEPIAAAILNQGVK